MNLQQQARHLNSIINLHRNLLREARYSNSITIPLLRDDGGKVVTVSSPLDLRYLPMGTRINMCWTELQVAPGNMVYPYSGGEMASTFEEFWDEMVACVAYQPHDDPEAMPRITYMPDTERN